MLKLANIGKTFGGPGGRTLLQGIDFLLPRGDYVAIMGESGAGKSTLLNLIAGLDEADSGDIVVDGQSLKELDDNALTLLRRRQMGFVFQAFHVLPHLSVAQNIELPLLLNGLSAGDAATRAGAMLSHVGLRNRGGSRPRELSGGELQRVAIARALVHEPRLLLADEPTGNLDLNNATAIARLLRDQLKRSGASGLLVTHSRLIAATADRVYRLTFDGLRLDDSFTPPA